VVHLPVGGLALLGHHVTLTEYWCGARPGGYCLLVVKNETQRLINRARSWADQLFIPKHRQRYEQLLALEMQRAPVGRDIARSRALSQLRRENRYEWARLRRHALDVVRREANWVDGTLGRSWELQVVCPRCGMGVGRKCRTVTGQRTAPHKARRLLAGVDGQGETDPVGEVVLADPRDVAAS
jgi:hypothetical protein